MNSRQFIAKQRVKYIWKSLKRTDLITGTAYRELEGETDKDAFWDFEPTPRNFKA
jgi:hypothetical protein